MRRNGKRERYLKKEQGYTLIIRFVIVIFMSYLIIQLSNEAKHMEEIAGIPQLQNTFDYAEKYLRDKYFWDWSKLGNYLYAPDRFAGSNNLRIKKDIGNIEIFYMGNSNYWILANYENKCAVEVEYGKEKFIKVGSVVDESYISYNIEYKNGVYLQNPEMEQQLRITTEEVTKWAENIRRIFEEEMQRMHDYQIEKAGRIRKGFANIGLAVCGLIILWKYCLAIKKSRGGEKRIGQCFNEIMAKSAGKLRKKRFILLGMAAAFWIYIMRPFFSCYVLFWLKGNASEYAAYVTSAMAAAIINVWFLIKAEEAEYRNEKMTVKNVRLKAALQTIAGCIMMVAAIRLGIVIVSDFYSHEWRFYGINFGAEAVSFLLLWVIMKIICRKQYNKI